VPSPSTATSITRSLTTRRGEGHPLRAVSQGVDLEKITRELEHEGIQTFCDSYEELLSCVKSMADALTASA
jgi:hypothetical protein